MTTVNTRRGFSVNVFLPTGDPEGLKVVEKSNWSGRGLVIPRTMFLASTGREELGRTGVYMLSGPSETSSMPTLYIGEGDPIRDRLISHNKDEAKDFWTHAVAFTSKDNNLNKAHIQHLESRLVSLAQSAKRCILANATAPAPPSMSEVDVATADAFLDDLLLCMPILGYNLFESGAAVAARETGGGKDEVLYLRGKGVEATGRQVASGFVVFRDSAGVGDDKVVPSFAIHVPSMKETRDDLIRQGVLVPKGGDYVMAEDYVFASPSTAAGVLLGRSSNGRVEWKAKDGRTLKELQETGAAT